MVEDGNCEFYLQCVEPVIGCDQDEYPRAYGYEYCKRLKEMDHLFDVQVKVFTNQPNNYK